MNDYSEIDNNHHSPEYIKAEEYNKEYERVEPREYKDIEPTE